MAKPGGRPARSFAARARPVIEKHIPETRGPEAYWGARPNQCWVRWPRAGGGFSYLALRRHLGWVTGEAGVALEPVELNALPLGAADAPADAPGYRVRLAELLGEEDRWWPTGDTTEELVRQLEWIVLQIRVKADAYFVRHPLPRAAIGG
jgi:hypothetical protein